MFTCCTIRTSQYISHNINNINNIFYNAAKAATCPPANIGNELGGKTLKAGVYCDAGAPLTLSSDLVLDGSASDIFIFQASSSFLSSLNTKITLINGALPENVFWAVGTSATIGTSSKFVGTLMTYASISVETSAMIYGQALAGAAVTFASSNAVTNPRVQA